MAFVVVIIVFGVSIGIAGIGVGVGREDCAAEGGGVEVQVSADERVGETGAEEDQRRRESAGGEDGAFGGDDYRAGSGIIGIIILIKAQVRIFGQPCTANASRNLLTAVGGREEDFIDGESLDEFRAGFCCVGQERSYRTLLLAGPATEGTVSTIMLLPGGVLRYDFVAVTELPGAFHEHLVSLVMLNVFPRDTHPITDSIQRVLKSGRSEERETLVSPLLPNVVLRL